MKSWGLLLIIAMMGSTAHAEDAQIRVGATVWARYLYDNTALNPPLLPVEQGDEVTSLARLPVVVSVPLSQLTASVRLSPHVIWTWGMETPELGMYEGVLELAWGDHLSLEVGRMVLSYGSEALWGSEPWSARGRTHDGLKLRAEWPSVGALEGVMVLLDEGGRTTDIPGIGDRFLTGVVGQFAGFEPFVWVRVAPPLLSERETAVDVTAGAFWKASWGALGVEVEGAIQGGEYLRGGDVTETAPPLDWLAGHARLEVALDLQRWQGPVLALEGFVASGDDPASDLYEGFDPLYPSVHDQLGALDRFARSNLGGGAFALSYAPWTWLQLATSVHVFARLEESEADYVAGRPLEAFAGVEWDVSAGFELAEGLVVDVFFGSLSQAGEAQDALRGWVELRWDLEPVAMQKGGAMAGRGAICRQGHKIAQHASIPMGSSVGSTLGTAHHPLDLAPVRR